MHRKTEYGAYKDYMVNKVEALRLSNIILNLCTRNVCRSIIVRCYK